MSTTLTVDAAAACLGVLPDADEPTIRAAYRRQVAAHPPDTDPDGFERVRDACDLLCDPLRRAAGVLDADPDAPLTDVLDANRFLGPGPWLDAISREMAG